MLSFNFIVNNSRLFRKELCILLFFFVFLCWSVIRLRLQTHRDPECSRGSIREVMDGWMDG